MNRCLTLGVLLVCIHCVLAQFPQYPGNVHEPRKEKVPEVDQKCLNCICEASSNCDTTIKCHNSAGGGYYCGPFQVSWAYWHDAGRPGDKGRAHDFEACLNNVTCAGETVRGYMRKYGRDCDKSRTIDCYDFARIHKLGYGACSDDSFYKTDFYEKFDVCYAAGYDDSPNNNDARYNNNDARYNNDGVYNNGGGYNNEGGYSNDGGANNDGSYNNDANVNSGGIGGFVDYGDDHIQARNARMGNA